MPPRWPGTHSDVRAPGNPSGDVLDGIGGVAKDGTPSAIEDAYADILAERRAEPSTAPVRSVLRKGAVCLRDARLWHRGMPSSGALPRHMLALVYTAAIIPRHSDGGSLREGGDQQKGTVDRAATYRGFNPPALAFSENCRPAFEAAPPHPMVDRNVAFVPAEEVDHMGHAIGYASPEKIRDYDGESDGWEDFWMPTEPVPLVGDGVRAASELPEWVRKVARGEKLAEGGPRL